MGPAGSADRQSWTDSGKRHQWHQLRPGRRKGILGQRRNHEATERRRAGAGGSVVGAVYKSGVSVRSLKRFDPHDRWATNILDESIASAAFAECGAVPAHLEFPKSWRISGS